jgi:hypothetical protein
MRIAWPAILLLGFIASSDSGAQSPPTPDVDPVVAQLVAAVDEVRVAQTVKSLAAFGTRQL